MRVHAPGTRLAQYEIIGPPLIGDTSVIYFCHDHNRSCPVVLKTLRPEFFPAARDCFLRAGAAWVDLGAHPHIVRCHEVLQSEDAADPYLVLELVFWKKGYDDTSLRPWLTPGHPLPVLQALLFALQIARGMRCVTEKVPGFVHGDLKPENVLVGAGRLSQADVNRLRVTDFGLAAVLREAGIEAAEVLDASGVSVDQTQLIHGIAGTLLYMAPEQWRGESAGTATDVYALGGILYEMLVGRRAVAGKTVEALERAHCEAKVRPLPYSLPEGVRTLTTRCLALEPGERYESWKAVEAAIAAAYEEIVSYPVPAAEPTDDLSQAERALVGWFYNLMGSSCTESGKADTALDCFQRALRYGHNEGDLGLVGAAASNLGVAYFALGDAHRDIEHQEQALAIAREIGDRKLEGSALHYLGAAYLQLGSPNQAVEYFEQGLTIAREIGDRQGEAACVGGLGNVYRNLGDLRRSADYHEQQLKIAREIGDRRGESVALGNLGVISIDLGDPRRAIQYEKQALEITREIGNWYAQATALNNLAGAYRQLGDARQALEYYQRVLEMTREIGNRRGEAFALNNMGSTHSSLGNMQRALEYHEQALAIFREIGYRRGEGECLTNSGYIYMKQNDIQRAIECCEQALVIDREIGDMMGVALDSFNMANLLAQQARFAKALPYAEEAAGILEKVGHKTKAPEARDLVAAIRAELDSWTSEEKEATTAIPFNIRQQIYRMRQDNPGLTASMTDEDIVTLLQQADRAAAKQKGEGVGPITVFVKRPGQSWEEQATIDPQDLKCSIEELLVRGQRLMNAGQWQEAEGTFSWMGSKAERTGNILYQSLALLFLGRIHTDRGKFAKATESLDRALELAKQVGDRQTVGVIHDSMGTLCAARGSYQEAVEYYTKAIVICKQMGDKPGIAVSQSNLSNALVHLGDFEQAGEACEDALEYFIEIGAEHEIAKSWCNLGRIYCQQGRYDASIEMLQKGQKAASRLGDELTVADACDNLGVVYNQLGNYALAINMHQKALDVLQRLGTKPGIGTANARLALVYQRAGDVGRALSHYETALEILQDTEDTHSTAEIHFSMGILHGEIGQIATAKQQYRKAQELFEALGDSQNAQRAAEESRRL